MDPYEHDQAGQPYGFGHHPEYAQNDLGYVGQGTLDAGGIPQQSQQPQLVTTAPFQPNAQPVQPSPASSSQPYDYPPFDRGSTIPDVVSVEEYGRTWQGYKPDKYFLPNDAIEQDRLDFSHAGFLRVLDGRLHLAPVEGDPRRVLDIGTGTGIWAVDFAREHPNSRVVGTDLALIQPDVAAEVPNVEFVREDPEDEWTHDLPFDFVHMRLMFTCFNDHREVIRKIYDNMQPGGWIESQELSMLIDSDDLSHRGTGLHKWGYLACAGAAAKGRDIEIGRRYKDYLEEVGFVDVVEKKMKFPGNAWPKETPARELGSMCEIIMAEVVKTISVKLLGEGLGLTKEALDEVISKAQEDIHNQDIHFYYTAYFVYGRKPYDYEQSAPPP